MNLYESIVKESLDDLFDEDYAKNDVSMDTVFELIAEKVGTTAEVVKNIFNLFKEHDFFEDPYDNIYWMDLYKTLKK